MCQKSFTVKSVWTFVRSLHDWYAPVNLTVRLSFPFFMNRRSYFKQKLKWPPSHELGRKRRGTPPDLLFLFRLISHSVNIITIIWVHLCVLKSRFSLERFGQEIEGYKALLWVRVSSLHQTVYQFSITGLDTDWCSATLEQTFWPDVFDILSSTKIMSL